MTDFECGLKSTTRVLLTAGTVLALGFQAAVAQETHGEIWPEVDAYVRLTSATRLYFSFRPAISADDGSLSESQLGANVDVAFAPMRRIHSQQVLTSRSGRRCLP